MDIETGSRPDPIRVAIVGKKGTGSHHLTIKEVERLIHALVKAKGTVEAKRNL